MNNEINVRTLCTGVKTSEPITKDRAMSRYLSDTSNNASGSIGSFYARDVKVVEDVKADSRRL